MFNVLFVDDDSFMLRAILRLAKRLRPDWQFWTEEDGLNWAKSIANDVNVDLIICDYLMPDVNGDRVLVEVSKHYPQAIRALLTGDTTEEVVCKAGKTAHFVLSKPFNEQDIVQLLTSVERVHKLPFSQDVRAMLGASALLLPLPDIVQQVRKVLLNQQSEAADIVDLIAHEPIITAKLLQLANSAFLGFSRTTLSIEEAIKRLGVDLTSAIISSIAIEQSATSIIDKSAQSRINEHAYQLALNAQKIAKALNLQKSLQEELFIAALMSSIGELILASRIWQDSFASQFTEWPVRKLIVSISAYLLTLWGYSESLCDNILSSAEPEVSNVEHNLALLLCLAHYATKYHGRIPDEILNKLPDEQIKLKLANL